MRRLIEVGVVGMLLSAVLVAVLTYGAAQNAPVSRPAFARPYDGRVLHDGLEILLVQSDGQAFATLARDPGLRRPDDFGTAAEAAYRAQRPVLPYLAWMGSLGRTSWVPPALAVLYCVAIGLASAALGGLLVDRGCSPWPALGILALPGTYAAVEYFGPEALALAGSAWGLWLWPRPGHRRLAIALFGLAALTRETSLLVPGALALGALRRRDVRAVGSLALPVLPLLAWYLVLRVRLGAYPFDAGNGRLGRPFAGLLTAVSGWSDPAADWAFLSVAAVIAVWVVLRCRDDPLAPVVAVHVAFATLLGADVWASWKYFGRVLLPLMAFGMVAIIGQVLHPSRPPAAAASGSSPPPCTPWRAPGSRAAAPAPPS